MFTESFKNNRQNQHMIDSDVSAKTKQIKIRDNRLGMNKDMNSQNKTTGKNSSAKDSDYNGKEKNSLKQGKTNFNSVNKLNKKEIFQSTQSMFNDLLGKNPDTTDYDELNTKQNTNNDLDLSVPKMYQKPLLRDARLIKSPVFFKNNEFFELTKKRQLEERKSSELANLSDDIRRKLCKTSKKKSKNFSPITCSNPAFFPLKSNQEAIKCSLPSSTQFMFQNDFSQRYSDDEPEDSIYSHHLSSNFPHPRDFVSPCENDMYSQSNSLFNPSFQANNYLNLNKRRSYSETDISKRPRTNPFLEYKRSVHSSDDCYPSMMLSHSEAYVTPRNVYQEKVSSNYNNENFVKPSYSYAQIITKALNSSPQGQLSLNEIYQWIEANFDYYKHANPVWKNSIRHNLSLSKCFKKIPREPGTRGKGGKWMLDKEFLLQEEIRKSGVKQNDENMGNAVCHQRIENKPDFNYH